MSAIFICSYLIFRWFSIVGYLTLYCIHFIALHSLSIYYGRVEYKYKNKQDTFIYATNKCWLCTFLLVWRFLVCENIPDWELFQATLQHCILEFSQQLYFFLLHTSSLVHRGTSVCFLLYQADIYICEENSPLPQLTPSPPCKKNPNLNLIVVIKHDFLSSKHTSDKANYFKWLRATGKAIVFFPKPLNFYCFKGVLKHGYEAIV